MDSHTYDKEKAKNGATEGTIQKEAPEILYTIENFIFLWYTLRRMTAWQKRCQPRTLP